MKYLSGIILIIIISLIQACTKEPASEPNLSVEILSELPVKTDEAVEFRITSDAEKVTIFTGDPLHVYDSVLDKGFALTEELFQYTYKFRGTYKLVALAINYGNWGEDKEKVIQSLNIDVLDMRTNFTQFAIVSPSSTGIIDDENKTITVVLPEGTDVSKLIARFRTKSPDAKVYVNDVEQESGKTVNDFSKDIKYEVAAPDASDEYSVIIQYE